MVPTFLTSLKRRRHLPRRTAAALTDLGYLLAAAFPSLQRPLRWWARSRYRRLAGQYDRVVETDASYFMPLNRVLPDLPDAAVIVEVGAGTGAATRRLAQRYPRAVVVAIDLSSAMLSHLASGTAAVVGDAFALPISSGVADLAVAHNAPPAMDELLRIVRPGGFAAVVLSTAGWIPSHLARLLVRRAASPAAAQMRERRAGAGAAWVFQKSGAPPEPPGR